MCFLGEERGVEHQQILAQDRSHVIRDRRQPRDLVNEIHHDIGVAPKRLAPRLVVLDLDLDCFQAGPVFGGLFGAHGAEREDIAIART